MKFLLKPEVKIEPVVVTLEVNDLYDVDILINNIKIAFFCESGKSLRLFKINKKDQERLHDIKFDDDKILIEDVL